MAFKCLKLVYLNGNNAAEGQNNIMNCEKLICTRHIWIVDRKWIEIVIGLGALWDWIDIACKCPFIHKNLNVIHVLQAATASSNCGVSVAREQQHNQDLRWLNRVMEDHEARASDLNRKLIFSFFLLFS